MQIFPAQIVETEGQLAIRYRYETPTRPEFSGELWFRVHERMGGWIFPGPEPAVAALAMLAMVLGEDMETTQPLSPRFHYGFAQFVAHFHLWQPDRLARISLRAPAHLRAPEASPGAVASCFSGGVDSFHTLYQHTGEGALNEDFRLTHLLFVQGFDIPVQNPLGAEFASEFGRLAESFGLELLVVATNVRELLDPHVPWLTTHGACIDACGLLLSGRLRRFIIPSTNRQSLLFSPCGSNPVTDPMLTTEALDIIHYGTHLSRLQKIAAIAECHEAQRHLRVCCQNLPGARNCGRCIKCLKTMMPLQLIGTLERFAVFPPLPPWTEIDPQCFAPLDVSRYAPEPSYAAELRDFARQRGMELPASAIH